MHEGLSFEKRLHGFTKKLEKGAAKATSLISKPPKLNRSSDCTKNRSINGINFQPKKEIEPFEVPPIISVDITTNEKDNDVLDNIMKNKWLSKNQRKTLMEVNEFFRKIKNQDKKKSPVKKKSEVKTIKLPNCDLPKKTKNYPDSDSRYSGDFRWWYMMRTYPDVMTNTIDYDEDLDYYMDRLYHWQQRDIFGESKSNHSSDPLQSVETITQRVTEQTIKAHPTFSKEFNQSHQARLPQHKKPIRAQINRIRATHKFNKIDIKSNHQDKSFWRSTKRFFSLFMMWLASLICCDHRSMPERKGMKLKALRQFQGQYLSRSDLLLKRKIKLFQSQRLKRRNCSNQKEQRECRNPILMGYQINKVNNKFINQLFTPVKLGLNGIDTHIQLDSGAATNLISADMADELEQKGLINFTYKSIKSQLTDVQNKVINQTRMPINVTLWFNETKSVNVYFQVVENLDYPLLGIGSMVENNISIINEEKGSYLCIGSIRDDSAIIRTVHFQPSEIFLSEKTIFHAGINKVSCYSSISEGIIDIEGGKNLDETVIKVPNQSLKITNHCADIQIINRSENDFEMIEDSFIGSISLCQEECVDRCKKVLVNTSNVDETKDNKLDERFKFPLSEEEGRKLLDSVEPFSFPMIDENTGEEIIDWEEEISKEGIFPAEHLSEFISFIKNKVPNIFSRTEYDCGKLDPKYGFVERFPMTSDEPIKSNYINWGPLRTAQMQNTFDKMEANGLLVKGHSPYATPCLTVAKADGRMRVVIDYRKINANCETYNQPVPRIGTIMQKIAIARPTVMSTFDICNAFHSLMLGEEAMRQASIITPTAQYLPTRLVFGYKNAPALFLQAMQKVFDELPKSEDGIPFCEFYFDDIIVFSRTPEEHLKHIKIVLELLHKVGLKIQSKKNHFFQNKLELLGKVVTGTTVSPQRKHIESLKRFPQPTTVKQLQSFLGICTWNCNLIPDYSPTIQPLTKLLRKNEPFIWGPDQEAAFQYLKELFTERTALYFIDYDQPIYVATDASDKFIAGIAYQVKSYSAEDIPKLRESLAHTKELHKLPKPSVEVIHPLLPKGAMGIPSPFKLTQEGIDSPHDMTKIQKDAQTEKIDKIDYEKETEDYLDDKERLHIVCNIGYYSSSLSKSQEGYSIIEKEALAAVSSLEFFKPFLQGARQVYLLTDSRPFLYIMKLMKCGVSRIQRWSVKLHSLPFELIMVHIKGTVNYSDTLTRVWTVQENDEPNVDMKKAIMIESPFKVGQILTLNDVQEALEKNPHLVTYSEKEPKISRYTKKVNLVKFSDTAKIKFVGSNMISELTKLTTPDEFMKEQLKDGFCKNLSEKPNKKFYKYKDLWYKMRTKQSEMNEQGRLVIPRSLAAHIIAMFHLENHCGVNNLCSQIKSLYFLPNLKATINDFTRMCHLCTIYKASTAPKVPIGLRELDPVPKGFCWSLDIVEGMPKYRNSGSFLSMVEYYSGYRIITPLKYSTSAEVARIIEKEIIATFGPPKLLISDGGSNLLKSKNVKKLTNFYGIDAKITSPYHPASHGRIEVSHQAITTLLNITSESLSRPWFDLCSFVQIALNSRPSNILAGKSPMYFMFGLEPSYRLKGNLDERNIPDLNEQKLIWKNHDEANRLVLKTYNEIRNKNNRKMGGKMADYQKGDYVWVRNFNKGPKQKIQPRFMTEPFEVIKDFGYAVLLRNYLGIVTQMHKNNVKRYHPRNLELFNALPFNIKLKLGSRFDQKELNKFFDELNKQEDEPIIKEVVDNNNPEVVKDHKSEGDSESDDDSETEEFSLPKESEKPTLVNPNSRSPDLPFHMKLRDRKVKFSN